jgi:predicted SprT family Zn-dependent metalloprotease
MEPRERARGMRHVSVAPPLLLESFVDCSKSIVIDCRCGEKLLLLGRKSDWGSEGRTAFECGGCGKKLSLKDGR